MGISSQLQAPVVLPPGWKFPVPTEQEDSLAPQSVWTLCSKDKCTALAGFKPQPLDWPARSLVTKATEPFQIWAHFRSMYMIKTVAINASLATKQRNGRLQLGRHHHGCPELRCTKKTVVAPAVPTAQNNFEVTNRKHSNDTALLTRYRWSGVKR